MKTNVLRKTVNMWEPSVMSADEAMEWLDGKGLKYELCDTPVPVSGNKVNCGKPLDAGEQTVDDFYYLPKSVTARPRCRFNWNACTTVQKGQKYFRNVLTDGPISRINFCTIPEAEIGNEQPIYGQYDAAFDEALKPYIDNLCAARGFVDCPQATKLAKKLQQECAEFARLSQDEVYWNLSFRACVIAWLKACVLYVANGCKWEKSIEDFVRWSLNYDLWCKMQFFGDAIRKANCVDETSGRRGPHNLLLDLPDVFSLEDARRVRRQQGLPDKGLRPMISNWKSRGYINQISEISFQKLRFKSDK